MADDGQIPMNLFNTCNKLWLLSSNIIGDNNDAIKINLIKDYNQNRIGKRLDPDKCITFDAMSVGAQKVAGNNITTIKNIIDKFYAYAKAIVAESHTRQPDATNANHNVLFQNPFFGESDSTFLGPDGVHDADPRGDMGGSKIIKKSPDTKKSNKTMASGGWRLISNTWIDGGREQLHDAIMRSTVCPTKDFCDDIANKEIDRTSWTTDYITNPGSQPPTLNPSSGHRFLSPIAEAERYISNVIYPMVQTCENIEEMEAVPNTKIAHLKHPELKGVFNMAELTKAIRNKYNLSNIYSSIKDIKKLSPDERAKLGIFMSFQYPVVIPGVNNTYFLRAALNSKLKHNGLKEVNAADFMRLIREKLKLVEMDEKYLSRAVNDGFSGGEKKKNEILQMLTLEPQLSILDETDSGLDIDALKIVAEGVNNFRNKERSFLAITHYQRLLDYMKPDYVHVLIDGKIVKSGDMTLAHELEEKGYSWLKA